MAIQVGGAHLHQLHAAFAGQEAGQGDFHLGVGQQEQAATLQLAAVGFEGAATANLQRIEHGGDSRGGQAEGRRRRFHPQTAPLHPKRIGAFDQLGAPVHQRPGGAAQEGLGQQQAGASSHRRQLGGAPRGQAAHPGHPHPLKQQPKTVFDRIGQGANNQQLIFVAARHQRQHRHQGVVFPLGEGGFDATAGIIQHPHPARQLGTKPFGGPLQIELDHLAGAGAHQKKGADLGAALQQLPHQPVQFFVGIGQAGQILFPQDRRAEAGFGKDHHPRRALDQVGTGAGAHHQEKGVRHAAMQPDDRGKPAKNLTLAALLEHLRQREIGADGWGDHGMLSISPQA